MSMPQPMPDDDLLAPLNATNSDDSDDFLASRIGETEAAYESLIAERDRAVNTPTPTEQLRAAAKIPTMKLSITQKLVTAFGDDNGDSPAPSGLKSLSTITADDNNSMTRTPERQHKKIELLANDDDLSPLDGEKAHQQPPAVKLKIVGALPATQHLSDLDANGLPGTLEDETDVLNVEGELTPLADLHIDDLLRTAQQAGGSDLHLTVNLPPMVRKDGRIIPLAFETAHDREIQRLIYDILTTEQIEKFERTKELDFSYGVKGLGRYRFNVYKQRGSVGAAMRVIASVIPSLESLKLPPILRELTRRHSGLILVTGPTGSGKSTTIASMIDVINTEREVHIMTIEDPIEYLHCHKTAMVNQRELGTDTDSFHNALRAVLREDPDVILVGELRDLETIAAAITLAETGHLVFATLHTRCAPATIDRIIDVFPAHQQEQIRIQLSTSLEAVVSQQLIPRIGGGRIAAIEIMTATSALRNLIREGKTFQMYSVIETGAQYGMQAMDKVLSDLHRSGYIGYEDALSRAIDRENFNRLLKNL